MPKRISKKRKSSPKSNPLKDFNETAFDLVSRSTAEPIPPPTPIFSKAQISHLMATMGRKGGKIGGKRSLETMTDQQRSERGLKAAQTRWKNHKKS